MSVISDALRRTEQAEHRRHLVQARTPDPALRRLHQALDESLRCPTPAPPDRNAPTRASRPRFAVAVLWTTIVVLAAVTLSTGVTHDARTQNADPLPPPADTPDAPAPRMAPGDRADPGDVGAIAARYQLGGVLRSGTDVLAVVNGTVVRPGDCVNGAELLSVDRSGVRMRCDGRDFRLALGSGDAP